MKTITWTGTTQNTDGSPFDQAQWAGYELELDGGTNAVAIPVTWATDNKYSFDISALQPAEGNHTFRIRTVAKNGSVSAWSNSASGVYKKVPNAPTALAAS